MRGYGPVECVHNQQQNFAGGVEQLGRSSDGNAFARGLVVEIAQHCPSTILAQPQRHAPPSSVAFSQLVAKLKLTHARDLLQLLFLNLKACFGKCDECYCLIICADGLLKIHSR